MKNKFDWGDDMIDSRDLIARHEDLQDEYDGLVSDLEEAKDNYDQHKTSKSSTDELSLTEEEEFEETLEELQEAIDEAQEALDQFNQSYEKDELDLLTEVIAEGEDAPDWNHGTAIIHENYFTQYTQDLIEDTCELPKEFISGQWPWSHVSIDFESAAEELKQDYKTIDADGQTYYLRA
jgi:flagellar hook-basal body complex protein FliE